MTKSTYYIVNYKSNCKVIGNSITVTVLDTALVGLFEIVGLVGLFEIVGLVGAVWGG